MANPLGNLGNLAAGAAGEAVAFGLGFALGRALEPAGTELRQEAWKIAPIKAPDAAILAEGVAQGQVDRGQAEEWARAHGFGDEAFAALVNIANTGPAIGTAFQAWRRDLLSDAEFTRALRRSGLETEWYGALRGLKAELLEPGALATAVHRGIMAGGGLLIREPPIGGGKVPSVPRSELSALEEFQGHGISAERARILVGNTGLPLALGQMLELMNRDLVEPDDVRRSIAQSNVRNEYMDVALELARRLLTPHEYVEARLRGWIDDDAMRAGAALHGMTADDADLMAKLSGRPLSFRQVFIGLQRGGRYNGPTGAIDPAFLKSLQESNVRPEWYSLAWAQRYTYPSSFVLRGLTQDGDLTRAEAERILVYEGWEPTLAKTVAGRWAAAGGGTAKGETKAELADEFEGGYLTEPEYRAALAELGYTGKVQDLLVHLGDARRLKRYREKVIDAIAATFLRFKIEDAAALRELAEVKVTGAAATMLLELWRKQRRDTVTLLTAAQVKKAYKAGLLDRDAALEELHDREYTLEDATILLDE